MVELVLSCERKHLAVFVPSPFGKEPALSLSKGRLRGIFPRVIARSPDYIGDDVATSFLLSCWRPA